MPTRLEQLRETLSNRQTDLQRLYNFDFLSTKLGIFGATLHVIAVSHPYFQYSNVGEYRGFISEVTKPGEIGISFIEDDHHRINSVFETWDGLKYNMATGIHYPKAVYEDEAILIYKGHVVYGGDQPEITTRSYALTGIYPINREQVSLSYDNSSILVLSVTFNVDDIKPLYVPFIDSTKSGL